MDKQQDLVLLDGAEVDGYTILKFKRKLRTCDLSNDIDIRVSFKISVSFTSIIFSDLKKLHFQGWFALFDICME